jgi:hypothetical protein
MFTIFIFSQNFTWEEGILREVFETACEWAIYGKKIVC